MIANNWSSVHLPSAIRLALSVLGALICVSFLMSSHVALAQSPDGVENTNDFPTDYWVASYYEGRDGIPGSTQWGTSSNGSGGTGTKIFRGEAFWGVGQTGTVTIASNGSRTDGRWTQNETPTSPSLPHPSYVGSTWTSNGNPYYQIDLRRTATASGNLTFGFAANEVLDDSLEVFVNGVRVYAYFPSGGAPNTRPGAGNGASIPIQAGDQVRIRFINLGFIGGFTFQFALPTAPTADLSLTKSVSNSAPFVGTAVTYTLNLTNSGPSTATGVRVRDVLPTGVSFVSATGNGSYNSSTGIWTPTDVSSGTSVQLQITATVTASAGTTVTNVAQVSAASTYDPDSRPDNGVVSEDDYATASFTVANGRAAGIPPELACPAGRSAFDWDTIPGWTAGSVDNSYAFATFGNVRFQLANDGVYVSNAVFGGQTPNVGTFLNGATGGNALQIASNQSNRSGVVTITITLPRRLTGLQFRLHDVDFASNQFADRLVVTGRNGATTINPVLTNGNVNYVSGNTAIGDGDAAPGEATGDVVVTFSQAIDTIIIQYGNHTTAPNNPGQQGVGLSDITVCDPFAAMSVTKVSSVISDPINGSGANAKAIPGAIVEYLITVANAGPEATDSGTVIVRDDGPAQAKMCLIGRTGGPVIFNEPAGTSGLSYTFSSLASATDSLEFSNDNGATFTYTPSQDADGCDTAITNFRVRPGGGLSAARSFTLTMRYIIE